MQILCLMSLFCLKATAFAFVIHVQSLSAPQQFMSLERHRWQTSRESPTLSVLGSSGMDRTIWIHVSWQSSLFFGVQFQSTADFQCTQKDCEEEFVMTDHQWAVLPFDTQTLHHQPPSPPFRRCHYLPLPSSPAPFFERLQTLSSQTLEPDFIIEKLRS